MTPFGRKMRELRRQRGVTQVDMASAVGVSAAYLSALEHGKKGQPSWYLVQKIIAYFNVIWDESEEITRLARISHPRVIIDTAGLSPRATETANRLASEIGTLSERQLAEILRVLDDVQDRSKAAATE